MLRLYIIEDGGNTDGYGHKQEQAICQHCAGSSQRIGISVYLEAIGSTEDVFMVKHGAVFAPFLSLGGEYYRLFTAMFLHFGVNTSGK